MTVAARLKLAAVGQTSQRGFAAPMCGKALPFRQAIVL